MGDTAVTRVIGTPFGAYAVTVRLSDGVERLVCSHFVGRPDLVKDGGRLVASPAPSSLLDEAEHQIVEYFNRRRRCFELPFSLAGTPFQIRVWEALTRIPYGKTVSYGELARSIDLAGAARAVGGACHRNQLGLIVPCHRVIGADGRLTGFAAGLVLKEQLLCFERGG